MFLKQLFNFIFNKSNIKYKVIVNSNDIQKREIYYKSNNISTIFVCYSAFLYKDNIRELVHNYKFQKKVFLSKVIAKILYDLILLKIPNFNDISLNYQIVCVPCHYFRVFQRGFNHMHLVCEELSKLSGVKFNKKFLIRSKYTPSLFNKSKKERKKYISGCFRINNKLKDINKDTKIILIDDLLTSGTTMKECINTLADNGYLNIHPFTLASTALK